MLSDANEKLKEWLKKFRDVMNDLAEQLEVESWALTVGSHVTLTLTFAA
jgi:hypothetical protein